MTYFIVCGRRRRLREEEGRDEEGIKKEEDVWRWAHEMSLPLFLRLRSNFFPLKNLTVSLFLFLERGG